MDLGVLRRPMVKTVVVMLVADLFGAVGDTSLKIGMKRIGNVFHQLGQLPEFAARVASEPYIWAGVGFLILFLALWLAVLSWADLSVVLPFTALSYVFGTLLALSYLGEHVSAWRWGGIALICIGVAVAVETMEQAS